MSKEESSGDVGAQDASDTPPKDPNADIYENRGPKKIIRVVTVMAYLFSVSFVGILLSTYYLFLWESPNPRLVERGRLRADPQLQFLIAEPATEKTDLKKDNFLLESELNRTYKPLMGRIAHDTYNGVPADSDEIDLAKFRQGRLNVMLLKLRHSLVEALRAQNPSLSHEAIYRGANNSFVKLLGRVEINSMKKMDHHTENLNPEYEESYGNISEKNIQIKNSTLDLHTKFANSVSALAVKNISSTSKFAIILEAEVNKSHPFGEGSVISADRNSTPMVEHKNKKWNSEKKLNVAGPYFTHGSSNAQSSDDATNGDRHDLEESSSSSTVREFLKTRIDLFELMKQNKTENRRMIDNNSSDVETIATSAEYIDDGTNHLLSINASVNCTRQKYLDNNECSSNNQTKQIAHDISTDSFPGSRDSGLNDDPGFHQPPDESAIKQPYAARNLEGERIRADLPAFPIVE